MFEFFKRRFLGDSFNPPSSSSILPGTYTVATLPNPVNYQAKYAFVTDLGGGSDMVISDGVYWKHIRQGVVTNIAVSSTVTVTPLSSPPIIQLTSSSPYIGTSNIAISPTNLYPGYLVHVIIPSNVLSTVVGSLGTLGISAVGGSTIPLTGGTWEDLQWNGTTLVELGKGTL